MKMSDCGTVIPEVVLERHAKLLTLEVKISIISMRFKLITGITI